LNPALRPRYARRRALHAAPLPQPVPHTEQGLIMSLAVAAAVFTAVLALMGVFGSPIIRWAAPTLMRTPRIAVAALSAVLALWLLGIAAIGPMLAWVTTSSSALLPGRAGEICQRCLDAASPLAP